MLLVGERGRRRGQYSIAELDDNGLFKSASTWVDKDKAVSEGYEELLNSTLTMTD